MNIGFYGHSNCAYLGEGSFLNLVADHFSAKIVNTGVKQGSEERILFELKKTKNLDVAVLFHSHPRFLFIPETDRDIDSKFFNSAKAEDLFRNDHLDIEFTADHNKIFKNKFKNNRNLYNAIDIYKEYFHHPDLSMNRFYGALVQIDQYISSKNIFAIHVLSIKNAVIPKWFEFKSGVVNYEIFEIIDNNPSKNNFFFNCITKEANQLVADKLINIIAGIKY